MFFDNVLKKLKFLPLLLALTLSSYFAWHGYYGQRGYEKWQELKEEYSKVSELSRETEAKKERLSLKVRSMYSDNLDADLLDEMARRILNLAGRNEIIIFD